MRLWCKQAQWRIRGEKLFSLEFIDFRCTLTTGKRCVVQRFVPKAVISYVAAVLEVRELLPGGLCQWDSEASRTQGT